MDRLLWRVHCKLQLKYDGLRLQNCCWFILCISSKPSCFHRVLYSLPSIARILMIAYMASTTVSFFFFIFINRTTIFSGFYSKASRDQIRRRFFSSSQNLHSSVSNGFFIIRFFLKQPVSSIENLNVSKLQMKLNGMVHFFFLAIFSF